MMKFEKPSIYSYRAGWLIVTAFIIGLAVFVFAAVAQAANLPGRVEAILAERGIVPGEGDYNIRNDSDGRGAYIAEWDEMILGPKPTGGDLDAVTSAQIQAVIDQEELDRFNARIQGDPLIRAMISREARRGNKTVQQILDELKAELP